MKMKSYVTKLVVTLMCLVGITSVSFAQEFVVMTEEYPPFNYTENGKLTGLASDVVVKLLDRVGHPNNIQVLPWSRSYHLIQTKDNHVLFSMVRTEQRENLFKWVGPVASDEMVFFAKKGSNISIKSLDDAKKVKKIGTYKESALELYLKEKGFTNFESVVNDELNAKKLNAGRIDLWISNKIPGIQTAKKVVGDASFLEEVLSLQKTQFYIAFSKSTPDSIISKWQGELDKMKNDGTYDAIVKKYGN